MFRTWVLYLFVSLFTEVLIQIEARTFRLSTKAPSRHDLKKVRKSVSSPDTLQKARTTLDLDNKALELEDYPCLYLERRFCEDKKHPFLHDCMMRHEESADTDCLMFLELHQECWREFLVTLTGKPKSSCGIVAYTKEALPCINSLRDKNLTRSSLSTTCSDFLSNYDNIRDEKNSLYEGRLGAFKNEQAALQQRINLDDSTALRKIKLFAENEERDKIRAKRETNFEAVLRRRGEQEDEHNFRKNREEVAKTSQKERREKEMKEVNANRKKQNLEPLKEEAFMTQNDVDDFNMEEYLKVTLNDNTLSEESEL